MKKLMYMDNGTVSIVIPVEKEKVEKLLGSMTDAEYKEHVILRSIPKGASYKEIDDIDIPSNREFRDAWVDITPETKIDIDIDKAKEIKLEVLRYERNKLLNESDKEITRAIESEDKVLINKVKIKRQKLRDSTEPLKILNTKGKINDTVLLDEIKKLSDKRKVLDVI